MLFAWIGFIRDGNETIPQDVQHQVNEFLQQQSGCTADGGQFAAGLLGRLEREQSLALYHEFFHL